MLLPQSLNVESILLPTKSAETAPQIIHANAESWLLTNNIDAVPQRVNDVNMLKLV